MKHTYPLRRAAAIGSFALFCSVLAFSIGLQTAGNVHTFQRTQAAVTGSVAALRGDVNGDGSLTVADAIALLERADGLEQATREEIARGDIDGDYALTTKDLLRLLLTLDHQ